MGCSPWGRKDSDMTERLHFHFSLFTFMHWRRKWQPTPVFLPGESQGQGSLVGCHLWGHTELHTTEVTEQQQQHSEYKELSQLRNTSIQLKKWVKDLNRHFSNMQGHQVLKYVHH